MLLVTGITGYSGTHFLQELINRKYDGQIRCVVRNTSNTSVIDNCGLRIEKIVGDLSNQELLNEAMIGVDTLVHIGSIFYSTVVMKAAVKHNVKRAVLVHTTGIYSKYKSASAEYKSIERQIEEIVRESNSSIGIVYLRPTMIYGHCNDSNIIVFIRMVDKLRLFPLINQGRNLLQPVHGRDLGIAYYRVLMKPEIINGDYILSGERPISTIDMFKLISQILGKTTSFISVPLGVGVAVARCLKFLSRGRVDYVEKVQRMGEDRHFSHDDAARDFNYKPMSFSAGLQGEIEEYLREKGKFGVCAQ